MSHRKAHWLGLCCALLVIFTCAASTTSSTASPGAIELSSANYSVSPRAGAVTITVNRLGSASGIVTASYGTANGSAIAGTDYTATFGTLTWPDGDSTPRTFVVPVAPGGAGGGSFAVSLLSVVGATFAAPLNATVSITAAGATTSPGAVELSAWAYSVVPSAGAVTVTVERVGGSSGIVVVSYGTSNGSAVAGTDYTATFGSLTWPDGDSTPQTFVVPVAPGGAGGGSFAVSLLSVIGATFASPLNATVSISAAAGGSAGSGCSSSSPTSSTVCLLAFINGLSGQSRHILSGQHTNYWDSNPMDIVTPIPAATGSQVAILGLTNYWTGTASTDYGTAPESFVEYANGWLEQGGIVLVSQSPPNPLSTVSGTLADVHTPGTAAYNQWHSYLDTQIAKFKQINGTVIWRPFIELNGSWSWWVSNEGSLQADFILIWQQTHDYFAANGVNNVLWLFNVNDWDSSADVTSWYPGSAYVDLVSLDAYPPGAQGDTPVYDALVATGKPVMYAEVGVHSSDDSSVTQQTYDNSTILATIEANFPKIFAVVIWCQNYALPLQLGESAFMSDPAIVTLSDVPAAFLNSSSTSGSSP